MKLKTQRSSTVSLVASLALASALCASCITSPVSISPSSVPVAQGAYTVVQENVDGRAFGFYVLGWPISEGRQMANARDRATAAGGGDALVNVTCDFTIINLLVCQFAWTTVNGDAIQLNQ